MQYLSSEKIEGLFQKYLELVPKFKEHNLVVIFEINSGFKSSEEDNHFLLNFYVYDKNIKQITYLTFAGISTFSPAEVCVDDLNEALEAILAKRNNTSTDTDEA